MATIHGTNRTRRHQDNRYLKYICGDNISLKSVYKLIPGGSAGITPIATIPSVG